MRDAEGCPTEIQDRSPVMLHALLETDIEIDEADPPAGTSDAAVDAA